MQSLNELRKKKEVNLDKQSKIKLIKSLPTLPLPSTKGCILSNSL